MKFETYFRGSSYAMIAGGALALVVSGGIGPLLTIICAVVMLGAWRAEGTRYRISERIGLAIVLLALPLFYFDWQYLLGTGLAREKVGVTALAHLILFLSGVKLWQDKADRDWVFLYLISFFEVLLAAGLSISPLFFLTLMVYVVASLNTVIAFEMYQARRLMSATPHVAQPEIVNDETRLLALSRKISVRRQARFKRGAARRLPLVAGLMLFFIIALATPLFLLMPRSANATMSRTSGVAAFTGFSDTVKLGDVGRLQQSDAVVMRVRVENPPDYPLRWRGVALDNFTGLVWRKSNPPNAANNPPRTSESNFYPLDTGPRSGQPLTIQTFYLEPLDTPVLFAASRPVALQGVMKLRVDSEGSLSSQGHDYERISYRVYSDTATPNPAALRTEQPVYDAAYRRYTQLPERLDPRIKQLTERVLDQAKPASLYDAARTIEAHLQRDYGYSLDMKASGENALADFLFNVRAGHCEYFASAMVVMLRTQGIAARLVNGFQTGAYNSAADAYIVTQRDAHSWVEVYFPQNNVWVTFDPTPPAGLSQHSAGTGFAARLGQYGEALEMLWIQYVVAYDKSEQRTLTGNVIKRFESFREQTGKLYDNLQKRVENWYKAAPNAPKMPSNVTFTRWHWLFGGLSLMLLSFAAWTWRAQLRALLARLFGRKTRPVSVVEFYERMLKALAQQGLKRAPHETPLEFALATGQPMPLRITDAYHRVRYGASPLTDNETREIETWLAELEKKKA